MMRTAIRDGIIYGSIAAATAFAFLRHQASNANNIFDALVLIDFDQFAGLNQFQVEAFIDAIIKRVIKNGHAKRASRIKFFAFGNRHSFQDDKVLIRLRNMTVTCIVVPSHKKEEADRHMERMPQMLRSLFGSSSSSSSSSIPLCRALVIVSNDQDFVALAVEEGRRMENAKLIWQTTYSSSNEKDQSALRTMRRFADDVWEEPKLQLNSKL